MSGMRTALLTTILAAIAGLGSAAAAQEAKQGEDHPPAAEPSSAAKADDHVKADDHGKSDAHGKADAHGAGHHDPFDLSHGNRTPALHQPQEWRFDLSIFTFVTFLLLLVILTKFAWGPIATALERREETIARQMDEARLASERAAQQLREYEARLAAATEEARQIVAGARKDAELAKDRIVAEAREVAQRERERAVADIATARNQALDEIAEKSVQTAVSLASQIIRREVRPQEHEALIGDAIGQFSRMNGS